MVNGVQLQLESERHTDGSISWNICMEQDGRLIWRFHPVDKDAAMKFAKTFRTIIDEYTVD